LSSSMIFNMRLNNLSMEIDLVFNCINNRYMIAWGQGGKNYGQKATCSRMFGKRQKDVGDVGT
jgi:hypothetical protein